MVVNNMLEAINTVVFVLVEVGRYGDESLTELCKMSVETIMQPLPIGGGACKYEVLIKDKVYSVKKVRNDLKGTYTVYVNKVHF